MKYFDKNIYHGMDLEDLHDYVGNTSTVVQNNLFYHEANDGADCEKHRTILAKSAYHAISILEAVIDRVPTDEREKALGCIREQVSVSMDDAAEEIARLFVGALFGMGD